MSEPTFTKLGPVISQEELRQHHATVAVPWLPGGLTGVSSPQQNFATGGGPVSGDMLRKVAAAVRAEAQDRRDKAANINSPSDGGAAALDAQVDAFLAGLRHTLPSGWQSYWEKVQRESHPDWATYQRLKAQFGGA